MEKNEFLTARVGRYRPPGQKYVRITAESCVDELDMQLLRYAQVQNGFVTHIPSGSKREASFTKLHLDLMDKWTFAERKTGTLYDAQGRSSSCDLVAEFT